ncbi:molybdopterin molybdotransferase MoeA [Nibribacter koreensis]|uniref:Molybdopterin molybdenumtransferase n=1 Tax=Nibribacter koreensis TaxID=1084519 RepID=A0ABP8F5Z8_9BACT
MISVEQALQLVLQETISFKIENVPLLQSLGRVLAQEVKADRDFPPFDRVTMDGIAINAKAFETGTRTFSIAQIQAAGQPPTTLDNPDNCVEVMTGAVLPVNATAVIRYEDCQILKELATVLIDHVKRGQNIHRQGADCLAGTVLLMPGQRITPAMIGTLASVGLSKVSVFQNPKIAICSTGDELVEIDQTPLPHQIRKSNVYMLAAALQEENIQASLFHLPDEPEAMRQQLTDIFRENEVVLLSGAVSKGKFDYLPQVLEQMRFWPIFHKIAQKPGKPMLFGKMPDGPLVFGFPGNPVSTFVCYQLYFKPWHKRCLGVSETPLWGQLAEDVTFAPALTYHVPVRLKNEKGIWKATPVPNTGSGNLTSILTAEGLLTLPADRTDFLVGEVFPVTLL